MFSGIVEGLGKPLKITKEKEGMRISIPIPKGWKLKVGESINVDGICSTIEKIDKVSFTIFYMPETLSKTNLSEISNNHNFNLERCLSLNSLMGGHMVSGHVDTTAIVKKIVDEKESKVIAFQIPPKFTKYIVYKGSITVNGVSLTIVTVTNNSFTVSFIPYTLTHTNLGVLKIGNKVNIEVDLLAKYLEKLVKKS